MKIIVDAFGGDNAPLEIIKGALLAKEEYGVDIILTGMQDEIKKTAEENNLDLTSVEIVNATQVITMDDEPNSVLKAKSDSSLAIGMKLLSEGYGDGLVSAGNSGSICVGATLIVKRIKGVKRPGFAPIMPHFNGGCFMLCDGGANIECRPEMLLQYAKMGSAYMEKVMKIKSPKIGLANVGTEEHKGNELQQNTFKLLKESRLNFIGNIEGRDIPEGVCDVVIADGFTGNIILKTYEGVAKSIMGEIKSLFSKNLKSKIAAGLVFSDLKRMKKDYDYNEYGGAPIMGCQKPVFKAHGSAKANTIKNAIRLTNDYIKSNVIKSISEAF